MKKRIDFVTNSSSSSFLICKKYLDEEQIEAIRKHSELGKKLNLAWADEAWHIEENEYFITVYTSMDNFYIADLFKIIGISDNLINWDEWEQELPEIYDIEPVKSFKESWRELLKEI